ncbi:hypothetical protein [Streptomyces sp. NPDC057966]|uniref:hypothetical protein n=1 Tax=Streptomyces sp. NPDC057966 TaxID=3346292 RepID=UPI0036ED408C
MAGAPLVGAAQAVPAPVPAALTAPSDPCQSLPEGSAARKYCTENKPSDDASAAPAKSKEDKEREKREEVCRYIVKGRAHDYCMGDGDAPEEGQKSEDEDKRNLLMGECKLPPHLETPGQGILGWIDPGPDKAPAARDPKAADADAYLYEQYGYAGLTWHTYGLTCGDKLRDPDTAMVAVDNWFANRVFTWSKSWTALTVVLRQYATHDGLFASLDPVVERATHAVRDAVYSPWIGTSLLLLGTAIIYQAKRKNLPDVTSQIAWALLVMTAATAVASYPVEASKMADKAINTTISSIDQAFAGVDLAGDGGLTPQTGGSTDPTLYSPPSGDRVQDSTAHGNMLVHSVLYRQWLRGELGSDDSAVAQKYGVQLFDCQALTWREARLPAKEQFKVVQAKMLRFREIAAKIEKEDPSAYSYLTGEKGGRLGASSISQAQAASSNLFSMAADLVIIGGKISLKFIVILFPALAVIGLHRRTSGVVKTAFNAGLAAVINIPLFALGGAVDVLMVREISSPQVDIPQWLKVVLLLLVTLVLWRMMRPVARLSSMINPNRNFMEDGGGALAAPGRLAKGAAKYYLGTRYLRRFLGRQTDALEDIAEGVSDRTTGSGSGSRSRAESDTDSGSGYWSDSWPSFGRRGQQDMTTGSDPLMESDPLALGGYETDSDSLPERRFAGLPAHSDHSGSAGSSMPVTGQRRTHDDVWDADGWYVEDLDGSAAARSLPSASRRAGGRDDADAAQAASPGPGSPSPLPSSGGAAAAVPSPRSTRTPEVEGTSAADLPGGPVPVMPEGDRPYPSEETGPRVVPPLTTDDGVVYQIFDPAAGYSIRDERDGQEPGGERQ